MLRSTRLSIPATPKIDRTPQWEEELEPHYRVLIHNDNVTPMDFVVRILESVFLVDTARAVDIMYAAHFTGLAYVQTLPKTEAQSRINKAHFAAGLDGYPLHFSMEPE